MSSYEVYADSKGIQSVYKGFESRMNALAFTKRMYLSTFDTVVLIEDKGASYSELKDRFSVMLRLPNYATCWLDVVN